MCALREGHLTARQLPDGAAHLSAADRVRPVPASRHVDADSSTDPHAHPDPDPERDALALP